MNVYFYTLGCKVNQYETQAMMHLMEQQGHTVDEYLLGKTTVGDGVIVINSCTVTGESDRKLRQLLRRCRREEPRSMLVLTGCMPQAFPEQAQALLQADIVLGNAVRNRLPAYIDQFLATRERVVDIPAHTTTYEPLTIREFQGRTRAFVKIEDGCNRFCTYCIIPYARGRVRSRPLYDLETELRGLAEQGYREVVLVGINLTSYGQDKGLTIVDAVECACRIDGIERVRLGSIEPDHMTPTIIEQLSRCDKLCPQFHLALQSGCDATLKRMNRHYDTAQYRRVCEQLRAAFPSCSFTTDVMVGFPGETQEEFEQSLAFVKDIGFSRLHCFPYSRREGTIAAKAAGQVSNAEKECRNRMMMAVGEESCRRFADQLVGQTVAVLWETVDETGVHGYTDTYVPVVAQEGEPGTISQVTVSHSENGVCYVKKTQAEE